jgi:signal transduction histidine kinase
MDAPQQELQLDGVFGAVGRLVVPSDLVAGRLTRLLGTFWLTGGCWVVLGWLLGVYDQGWRLGIAGLGVAAIVLGALLLSLHQRRLGTTLDVALTLLGSLCIALATLWAGQRGVGVTGVLYVYVTCFAAISLRRQAVAVTLVSAGMHLVALLVAGYEAALAIWGFTWGTAIVAGLVVGAAVDWLRQLVGRLEEADEHKTRFVATVSHELRTPLTAILGFSETLQRDWDRFDEDERRRFIAVIERQAGRQLRLVEDVLTMATLMRGSLTAQPERVELAGVVAEIVELLPFQVDVDIAESASATVDPHHLERILDNLLVNADRYGEPPLIVRAAPNTRGTRIDVVDHGAGISGGLDDRLLEAFVQGDSGDRRSSVGVGLGLTLCRDLLDLNHGWLEYAETPGGGATLRVTLPA